MNARTISANGVFAGAAMAALMLATSAGAQTRRTEKHFAVEGKPIVTVQNPNGRIQVKAWDKHEVMVLGQSAGAGVAVDTEQAGNRIEIATRPTDSNVSTGDLRTDYEISVPTETANTPSISSVCGGLTIFTSSP